MTSKTESAHTLYCRYCDTRDVTPLPNQIYLVCSVCNDTLDRIALCPCGADADEVDGETCLPCLATQVRAGEADVEMMAPALAKRLVAHMNKPVEARVPQLMRRQA